MDDLGVVFPKTHSHNFGSERVLDTEEILDRIYPARGRHFQ